MSTHHDTPPASIPPEESAEPAGDDIITSKRLETIALAVIAVLGIGVITYLLFIEPSRGLAIEEIPFIAFAYSGHVEGCQGQGTLEITNKLDSNIGYQLHYALPDQVEDDECAYAGLAFRFPEMQNLTAYNAIEVAIEFENDSADCLLEITDSSGEKESFHMRSLPSRVNENGYRTYQAPLPGTFSEVTEIGCNIDPTFASGNHSFTIYDIRFLQ